MTPLQLVLLVSIGASTLAVGLPNFYNNLHASRLNEPLEGLTQIAARASAGAAAVPPNWAYPATVALTPSKVPHGLKSDAPGIWQQPTWKKLGFKFGRAHHYSFEFKSRNGASNASFLARAVGDLDQDGQASNFELRGTTDDLSGPKIYPNEKRG